MSAPSRVNRWTVLRSPPITPVAGETSLATIQSQPLRVEFCLGVVDQVFGLGGEPDHQRRPLVREFRDRGEDVRIFHELQRRHAGGGLLQFLLALIGDAPVGDRGGEDRDVRRQRGLHLLQHVARGFHMLHRHARGIVEIDRARDQGDIRAGCLRRRGDGKTLLAGGAVGDVAHGIDRLVRWTRRLSSTRLPASGRGCGGRSKRSAAAAISSGSAIRPMPASPASAISPALGPTMPMPSRCELRDVAAGRGIVPHQRVHRRRQQDRPVRREQDGAGEIVGVALRHLRHQVGGRRRHHDQVAVAREPDMAGIEFALGVEQVGVGALVRQSAGRKGVTNCCAALVSTQRTWMCRSFSRRIRSSAL